MEQLILNNNDNNIKIVEVGSEYEYNGKKFIPVILRQANGVLFNQCLYFAWEHDFKFENIKLGFVIFTKDVGSIAQVSIRKKNISSLYSSISLQMKMYWQTGLGDFVYLKFLKIHKLSDSECLKIFVV